MALTIDGSDPTGDLGDLLASKAPTESPTFTGSVTIPNVNLGGQVSYTPTWSGAITVGNGTSSGSYIRIGRFVTFFASFTFGSTSSMGTGLVGVTLPVALNTGGQTLIECASAGNNSFFGTQLTSTTYGFPNQNNNGAGALFTSTYPFTWKSTDLLVLRGWYWSGS